MKHILNVLLISLYVGCGHMSHVEAPSNSSCDYDPAQKTEFQSSPFVMNFSGKLGEILFIAATHGVEAQNKVTFDLIRDAFKKYTFNRVIVEGLDNSEGVSPSSYIQSIKDGHRKMGEPAFLAMESLKRSIEFVGGEISDNELLKLLQKSGFSQKDLAGLYILRTWGSDFDLNIEQLIKDKSFPIADQFKSETDFQTWFKDSYGQELPKIRDPKLSRPFQNRSDRLQNLANEVTWARDRFLAEVISTSFKEKKKILVVYGSGHATSQKCFISKWWKP